jgi:uncharacterized protein YecE (DUF72 family)
LGRIFAVRPPSFITGTSGWSYKDWVGPFYPPGTPEKKFLEFYATKFPGVEVDSTFYRTPSAKTAEAWNKATPEGFPPICTAADPEGSRG